MCPHASAILSSEAQRSYVRSSEEPVRSLLQTKRGSPSSEMPTLVLWPVLTLRVSPCFRFCMGSVCLLVVSHGKTVAKHGPVPFLSEVKVGVDNVMTDMVVAKSTIAAKMITKTAFQKELLWEN